MQKFATEDSKSLWKHLSTMFDTVYSSCASGIVLSVFVMMCILPYENYI